MSMMSPEAVGLDVNIGGNFGASLSQMIAQSDAYARSADTMLGKVGLLNVGVTALISKTAALTGVNKLATAEAAAYQERLAGIAGTARVTGQSFAALEKTTMSLARSTGNIGQAVATVESLGTAGITSAKSIDSLAKSWTNLGVANQTSGIELGRTLLNLGRTFGNSEKQLQSYGDSLTATSKMYGASADAAAGYAKALAPVAASVGMTQSSVLGLGVAASRLGEEGYASANAFNKVLLDMGRSIRNGSPEIKEYAGLLGLTQKNLADLFKQDPTEVLLRFTEAIGKGGPQAMRTLEALGLDATRTVRSITALSSQGNLRAIVNESTASYGKGSTAEAAAASLDTVNHQMQRLGETMSQTVAAAGKPFLGFLDGVLKAANAASGAVNNIVSSDFAQGLQKVAAPVGFVASAASSVVSTLGLVGLGAVGLRAGRGAIGDFRGGAAEARAGGAGTGLGRLASLGFQYGGFLPEPLLGGGMPGGGGGGRTWGQRASGVGRATLNWGAILADSQSRMIDQIDGGRLTPYSAAGQSARSAYGSIWSQSGQAFGGRNPIENFGKRLEASAQVASTWSKEVSTANNATARFGKSMLNMGASVGSGVGSIAGRGVGLAGSLMGGVGPMGLGIMAGVGALTYAQSEAKRQEGIHEEIRAGAQDAYANFNEFAAAAGIAGKGLIGFSEQIQKTTQDIANAASVNAQGQVSFTPEMARAASAPGYQAAYTRDKDRGTAYDVTRMRLMLGPNPSPAAVSRFAMDIASQGGDATELLKQYNAQTGDRPTDTYRRGISAAAGTYNWKGATDETKALGADIAGEAQRRIGQAAEVYGPEATGAAQTREVQRVFESMRGVTDSRQQKIAADVLASITKGDAGQFAAILSRPEVQGGQQNGLQAWIDMQAGLKASGGQVVGQDFLTTALGVPGAGGRAEVTVGAGGAPGNMLAARDLDRGISALTGHTSELGRAMYEATDAARKYGVNVEDLTDTQTQGMSDLSKALLEYRKAPSDVTLGEAGRLAARDALTGSGGSRAVANAALMQQMAGLVAEDPNRIAFGMARQQLAAGAVVGDRTLSMYQRTGGALQAGQVARGLGVQTGDAETDRQAMLTSEQQAYAERLDFQKQFITASKALDLQLVRQAEDTGIARARAEEDYQRQVSYATDDFYRQRHIAERDFGISMQRAAEDSAKSMYDPYQRIQATMVADTASLLVNLGEQNEAINKQTSQVSQLRRMGLSRQAIDTLSLSDPKNAQQVSRMLDEMTTNPAMIRMMNATITRRVGASRRATQNDNNVDFRRATEDFDKAMKDSSKNFAIQMDRMGDAHELQLDRMASDTARARHRAQEDLAKMGQEVTGSVESIARQFVRRVGRMPADVGPVMSANMKDMVATAVTDAQAEMAKLTDPMSLASTMQSLFEALATKWGKTAHANAINIPPGLGGAGAGPQITPTAVRQTLPHTYRQAIGEGAAQDAHADRNWQGLCDRFIAVAYGLQHSGYTSAKDHWNSIPGQYKTGGHNAPPGALYFWGNGQYGHTALSIGSGLVYSTDFVRNGQVDVTSEDSITRSWGDYRGWSFPYFGGKTAPVQMWQGGIATRPMNIDIAERGGAEAVIPLNRGGANVLAEAMVRYVDSDKVHGSQMARYGTQVITYSYDHSTRVEGPITVQSQDPEDMGRQLEERARQRRLVQPVG